MTFNNKDRFLNAWMYNNQFFFISSFSECCCLIQTLSMICECTHEESATYSRYKRYEKNFTKLIWCVRKKGEWDGRKKQQALIKAAAATTCWVF